MDWLTKLWNHITTGKASGASKTPAAKTVAAKVSSEPIIKTTAPAQKPNEIPIAREMSEQQAQIETTRSKYFDVIKNPDHKVREGENPDKIAKKYGVETSTLLVYNGLNENSKIKPGQILKIPPTRKLKNVNNLLVH